MKIDLCSDLHHDHWINFKNKKKLKKHDISSIINPSFSFDWQLYKEQLGNDGEILIIAGDLSDNPTLSKNIVNDAANVYDHVFFVDGNHDHFNKMSLRKNLDYWNCENKDNVHFLNPDSIGYIIEDVAIVGINGWYDWACYENVGYSKQEAKAYWQKTMADASLINFDTRLPDNLASENVELLSLAIDQAQLNDLVNSIIVITHSSPLAALMQWKNNDWNLGTPSFVNSQMMKVLQVDFRHKIKYWIYGHTHHRQTVDIDGVTFINNCRGYPQEIPEEWRLQRIEAGIP